MTTVRPDALHLQPTAPALLQDPKRMLGVAALFAWFGALTLTDFAHDALGLGAAGSASTGVGAAAYELASGYVLGFVAAVAVALMGGLLRGTSADETGRPWLRRLAAAALFVVALACLAGAAVHNADGLTLLYDIAFVSGLAAVFAGVVPLHRHLMGQRED